MSIRHLQNVSVEPSNDPGKQLEEYSVRQCYLQK